VEGCHGAGGDGGAIGSGTERQRAVGGRTREQLGAAAGAERGGGRRPGARRGEGPPGAAVGAAVGGGGERERGRHGFSKRVGGWVLCGFLTLVDENRVFRRSKWDPRKHHVFRRSRALVHEKHLVFRRL
jgi:hypothetical protein